MILVIRCFKFIHAIIFTISLTKRQQLLSLSCIDSFLFFFKHIKRLCVLSFSLLFFTPMRNKCDERNVLIGSSGYIDAKKNRSRVLSFFFFIISIKRFNGSFSVRKFCLYFFRLRRIFYFN